MFHQRVVELTYGDEAFSHLCVDREELSLAGAGINVIGKKETLSAV